MIKALMPVIIFGLVFGVLGFRWAKQEREETRARFRALDERIKARRR